MDFKWRSPGYPLPFQGLVTIPNSRIMSNTIIYEREKCLRKEKLSFFYYFHVTETLITHDITRGINDVSLTLCHKFNATHVRVIISLLNMADERMISPTTNTYVFSENVMTFLSVDYCFISSRCRIINSAALTWCWEPICNDANNLAKHPARSQVERASFSRQSLTLCPPGDHVIWPFAASHEAQ